MFTTPCFIRKSTLELKKQLEELGYDVSRILAIPDSVLVLGVEDDIADEFGLENECAIEIIIGMGHIDCGDNEDLFLALAALRDDTDYMQWFTDGEDWFLCEKKSLYDYEWIGIEDYIKATPEELITHSKKRNDERQHNDTRRINSFI